MIGKAKLWRIPSEDEAIFLHITKIIKINETSFLVYVSKKNIAPAIGFEGTVIHENEYVLVNDNNNTYILKYICFFQLKETKMSLTHTVKVKGMISSAEME